MLKVAGLTLQAYDICAAVSSESQLLNGHCIFLLRLSVSSESCSRSDPAKPAVLP